MKRKIQLFALILVALFSLVECSRKPAPTPLDTSTPAVEASATAGLATAPAAGTGETAYPAPLGTLTATAGDAAATTVETGTAEPYPGAAPIWSPNIYPEPSGSEAAPTETPAAVQRTAPNPSSTPTTIPAIDATMLALPTIGSTGPTATLPSGSPTPSTPVSTSSTPGTPASTTSGTGSPTPRPSATAARPTATATVAPTEEFKLRATDPSTVKLASGEVQLIEFFAFWCGPCRAMAPVMNRLENRFGRQMNFIYLDTDDPQTRELQRALRYRDQPHFFLLDERGKVLYQWQGYVEEQVLAEAMKGVLGL